LKEGEVAGIMYRFRLRTRLRKYWGRFRIRRDYELRGSERRLRISLERGLVASRMREGVLNPLADLGMRSVWVWFVKALELCHESDQTPAQSTIKAHSPSTLTAMRRTISTRKTLPPLTSSITVLLKCERIAIPL
jgi:hypothetical protein